MSSVDAVVAQIIDLLSTVDTSAILTHPTFRDAVLDLIGQGGRDFRDEVSILLDADKRIHKIPTSGNEGPCDEVHDFFKDKRYANGKSCDGMIPSLKKVLLDLEAGFAVKPKDYRLSAPESNVHGLTRQAEVVRHLKTLEAESHVVAGKRRLWLLRLCYEVDRLLPNVVVGKDEKSDIAAAEREFAQLSGEGRENIRTFRTNAHKYTIVANWENGLGFLLLLGTQTKWIWEHGLNKDVVAWLWDFCKTKRNYLLERAKELQPLACDVVRQGFTHAESAELFAQGHVLSRHFRANLRRNSPNGLETLAAAIDQVQAQEPGFISGFAQRQSERNTQARQRQNAARDANFIAGQLPRRSLNELGIPLPATYGKHVHSSWQTHADRNPGIVEEALAEVADSQSLDNHTEQQPGGADLLAPSCVAGAPDDRLINAPIQVPSSDQNSATNAEAFSEGIATGQVQAPGPAETASDSTALDGQVLQSQLQTHSVRDDLQQPIPQHDLLYGAQSRKQYEFGHAGTTVGRQNTPSGWWRAADSRSLHETMAPHFLPDNGMNSTYHSTVGSGYSFDDEWRRTVEEMYVEHEDGTSYP